MTSPDGPYRDEFVDFINGDFIRTDTNILTLNGGDDDFSGSEDFVWEQGSFDGEALPQVQDHALAGAAAGSPPAPEPEADVPSNGDQQSAQVSASDWHRQFSRWSQECAPENGILDEYTIAQGLSNLGKTADGTGQVYLHVTLPGYDLTDINALGKYTHLQKVELLYNKLTDLSVLGSLPYLLELDASHNDITDLLDFDPPHNLRVVDMSFNHITTMTDLSTHHCLHALILDNNQITEIRGLENCHRLTTLSLGHNQIETIDRLANLPIKNLNLKNNLISKIEGLETLKFLQVIDLSANKLRSMAGLENHEFLESINLEDNELFDISEVQHIKRLDLMRHLDLQCNPVRELPDYRLSIVYHIPQLATLDHKHVNTEEKVAAQTMFNPPIEVLAARDHVMNVVYSFLQPSRILDSTLPSIETPYPMLVLVGPQGSGKKELALKLVEEFPDYFGYGIAHTTRKPNAEEMPNRDYTFISLEEFEHGIKLGKFLQTFSYQGDMYGLTIDAVETVAREGLACVVHMELEGVLTLKNTYFEPRYVLLMPLNSRIHEKRLRERCLYPDSQVEHVLERAEVYAAYNLEHAGFFDMYINSDDLTESYKKLRKLVMDYLGISVPTPSVSDLEQSASELTIEKETTGDLNTAPPSGHLSRSWSKTIINDSFSQSLLNTKMKTQMSQSPDTDRGIVEAESLKRRHTTAYELVCGRIPSIYDRIRFTRTVPQDVNDQTGLDDETDPKPNRIRSYSAPVGNPDALPPNSPDSSDFRTESGSGLSNISEARDAEQEHGGGDSGSEGFPENLGLPVEALDRITLLSGSPAKNGSSVPLAPRPGSGDRVVSQLSGVYSNRSSRPGSDRHAVLPPIAQCS